MLIPCDCIAKCKNYLTCLENNIPELNKKRSNLYNPQMAEMENQNKTDLFISSHNAYGKRKTKSVNLGTTKPL